MKDETRTKFEGEELYGALQKRLHGPRPRPFEMNSGAAPPGD